MHFTDVYINNFNATISAKNLIANRIGVYAINGTIKGNYTTDILDWDLRPSMTMMTTNAEITVNVTIVANKTVTRISSPPGEPKDAQVYFSNKNGCLSS